MRDMRVLALRRYPLKSGDMLHHTFSIEFFILYLMENMLIADVDNTTTRKASLATRKY